MQPQSNFCPVQPIASFASNNITIFLTHNKMQTQKNNKKMKKKEEQVEKY